MDGLIARHRITWIFLVFLAFYTTETISFEVNGSITMENTTDISTTATAGDLVMFTFDVQIDLETDNFAVVITIAGDALEFKNQSYIDAVTWTLDDGSGNFSFAKNDSDWGTYEEIFLPYNTEGGLAYFLSIDGGLPAGQWSFNGTYEMTVRDDITVGSLIRSVITVTVLWTPYNASSRTLPSNYAVVPHPNVTGVAKSNLTQPIMGYFTSHIVMESPRDVRKCIVQCYTNPENISKEVRLTVQGMSVATDNTYGTTAGVLDSLKYIDGVKASSLASYQNNIAVMELPDVPIDVPTYSQVVVASSFTVRVEDYSELETGDQWPVHMGASFSSNIVWAGWIDVNITAPAVRVPHLGVKMSQSTTCAYDGSATKKFKVLVEHTGDSTATAYNVTVNIYMPDYMTLKWQTFPTPKENSISVSQQGTVITAEITRLTFSDPFSLDVTLSVDLSSRQIREAKKRIVVAESICNDRWGNATDLMSTPVYISLITNRVCAKRLTWTGTTTCTCSYSTTRKDCGCCKNSACQCGAVNPKICVPCNEMWRCAGLKHKDGFEKLSYYSGKNIRCDAFFRRRGSATGVSCHKQISASPKKYLEMSPRVAVLTGRNLVTGNMYGISNNGLVYVKSEDDGQTWGSIPDDEYVTATLAADFEWSIFSNSIWL